MRPPCGRHRRLGATVLARDPVSDLALLKIDHNKPLPVMPLGTAKDLQVGETVVAIGNAYGYDHTVTVGVVQRGWPRRHPQQGCSLSLLLIQTDASINPGNSGGPLINLHGELVGVNVAIRAGAQGIGFAIPVDTMITVASGMLADLQANQRSSMGNWGAVVLRDRVPGSGPNKEASILPASAGLLWIASRRGPPARPVFARAM